MTARRFLPLVPALLAACLFTAPFEAHATDLRVDSAVTQTNNGVILDGDGKIEITSKGSITVDASSPALPAPLDFERNTGILLRGAGSSFGSPSSNNTITNNGKIIVSGANSEGVHVVDIAEGTDNTLTNNGLIRASGASAKGVVFSLNSTIINNGTIETLGNDASRPIFMTASANAEITNNGLIRTTAQSNAGEAIFIEGPGRGGKITNNAGGRIRQEGDNAAAIAIAGEAAGFTVNNAGEITASGAASRSKGIFFSHNSANSNNTLNNSGTITTNGDGAQAVLFGSAFVNNSTGNKLNNTGTIETKGEGSNAVQGGNRNTILNDTGGAITTSGRASYGISVGNDNTIVNNGTITTANNSAFAIRAGDGNDITNNGTITVSGERASAISVDNNNTVTNNRDIITTGRFSHGISVISTASSTIINNGNITTSKEGSRGITVVDGNTVTHTGTITTEGRQSEGIQARDNNTLTLNGTITTKGRGAHGVRAGTGTKLNPIGPNSRIQTMAADADGLRIRSLAAGQTLTHRGHIEAGRTGIRLPYVPTFDNSGTIQGRNGAGLHFTGVTRPLRLTNTGTIAGQTGIQIDRTGAGANISIDNAGTLRALQGVAGTALDLRGQGQDTLHLRADSTLEGQIRWDGEGDLLRLEALGPTRLTFIDNDAPANTEPTAFTVNKPQGLPVLRSTMTSGTAGEAQTTLTILNPARTDPRTEATQSLWISAIFQSLAQQQRVQQTLQSGANRRSGHDVSHSALWVRPFGGLQNYKRAGQTPAARYRYGGALAGYGMATAEWQAGAFLGAARSALMSRGQDIEIEGREVFLGAYGQTRWQALNLSVAVLLGQSRHDTAWLWRDNRVSGGLARREYAGKHDFISPELGLSTRLNIQGMTLIPELKLRYLGLFNAEARARQADGLHFKPEDRHIGLIRASVGFPLSFPENQYGGRLSGQLRLGAEGRKRLGGDTTEVRSGGDTRRYRVGDDNAVMGFVGAGFEYGVSAMNLSFSADVEAGYDSEAALGVRGQLGFVWGF